MPIAIISDKPCEKCGNTQYYVADQYFAEQTKGEDENNKEIAKMKQQAKDNAVCVICKDGDASDLINPMLAKNYGTQ